MPVKVLRTLIRAIAYRSNVIFLLETKALESRISHVARLIGFSNFVCVEARGRARGICMFWSYNVQLDVVEYAPHLIGVNLLDSVGIWTLVEFYGPPYKNSRRIAWENLHAFLAFIDGPWVCLADLNIVLDDSEKEGGIIGGSSMPNFLTVLMFDLGVVDLGFAGNKFT